MVVSKNNDHLNQAEFFYRISLLHSPNDTNTMRGASYTFFRQGDKEGAIAIIKKALSIEYIPHNLMLMARIAFACNDLDLAFKSCSDGLDIVPDDSEFMEMKTTVEDKIANGPLEQDDENDFDDDDAFDDDDDSDEQSETSIFALILELLDRYMSHSTLLEHVSLLDEESRPHFSIALQMAQKAFSTNPTLRNHLVLTRSAYACEQFELALKTCDDGLVIDVDNQDLLDMKKIITKKIK